MAEPIESHMEKLQIVPVEGKKRKPQGTLVNPYLKKRRVQGAKFDTT
jgi:hypothetical protein